MFADDIIIFLGDRNVKKVERKLNIDLENVVRWLRKNALKLNTTKMKFMIIHDMHKLNMTNVCDIKIENIQIKETNEIKYLGVIIDNHLNLNSQAMYIVKKAAKKINFMYRINKFM